MSLTPLMGCHNCGTHASYAECRCWCHKPTEPAHHG